MTKTCSLSWCNNEHRAKGFCSNHWRLNNLGLKIAPKKSKQDKIKLILQLKDAPCMDCATRFPSVCMDFDHVPERGAKLFGINSHDAIRRPWEDIISELKKCDLVCSNCHRIRTNGRALKAKRDFVCRAEGCQSAVHSAKGYCNRCYLRTKKEEAR